MHPEPPNLTALAYGLTESPEREFLLEHLAECETCRAAYDEYLHEQATVREAVIRDARSGPAEARALERTLLMLDRAQAGEGRVRRLARWRWALPAAAALVLAAGMWFTLGPVPETEFVQVSEQDRAPALIEEGIVYVPASGAWRKAEAVPLDEWVKSGEEPLRLDVNGAKAELARHSIFRISMASDDPVVNVLHGNVRVNAHGERRFVVRAGEAGMYVLPGSVLELVCDGGERASLETRALRSWEMPQLVSAEVKRGDVLLAPSSRRFMSLPLRYGESVRWTRGFLEARDAAGALLPLQAAAADDSDEQAAEQARWVWQRFDEINDRYAELASVVEPHLPDWGRQGEGVRFYVRHFGPADGYAADLTTHGDVLRLVIHRAGQRNTSTAATPEELPEQVPSEQQALLDVFELSPSNQGWSVERIAQRPTRQAEKTPGSSER